MKAPTLPLHVSEPVLEGVTPPSVGDAIRKAASENQKPLVLVVVDDPAVRDLMQHSLSTERYRV